MIIISLQRKKCIGCGYCADFSPEYFCMSKQDGKSILIKSKKKKDFYILKTSMIDYYKNNQKAAQACPVKIIQIKKTKN